MKALPSLSDTLRRLSPRERRVVLAGALVATVAVTVTLLVLPAARRWTSREAAYAPARDQWTRLAALVAGEAGMRQELEKQRLGHGAERARLVPGATPALAASTLQGLLQRYADESLIQLDRVDVAGEPRPDTSGLTFIPVQLQGQADISGLVDFLYRLEHGDKLLVIDDLTVNAGPEAGDGRQYLTWAVRLHGLYAGAVDPT